MDQQQQIILIPLQAPHKWEPIVVSLPATVGRIDRANIVIPHESLSGIHAQLQWDNGLVIQDLESTNGTRIDGERITTSMANDGNIVSFGSLNYVIKLNSDSLPRLFFTETHQLIALGLLPFHIGRNDGNSMVINEQSISGRHITIATKQNSLWVYDHESTNGTRLNGRRIRCAPIQDGDNITIGKIKVIVLLKDTVPQNYCLSMNLDGQNKIFPLQQSQVKIGRNAENDLVIPQSSISGAHALLYWAQGRYWVKDLGSRNGTYVAGIRVTESPLRSGDEIKIGKHPILFTNSQDQQRKFYLVMLGGERGGEEFILDRPQVQIGRTDTCHICLPDKSVSKIHAMLELEQEKYIIKDLGSTNGVLVNGKLVPSIALNNGDQIKLGEYTLIFRDASLPRPESLVEETFVLIEAGTKGYGRSWCLDESCSIGSGDDNTIVTKHASIAPHHAILRKQDNGYLVDNCDNNNVFVNQEKARQHRLEHGDEIQIGTKRYIFKSTLRPLETQANKLENKQSLIKSAILLASLVLLCLLVALALKFINPPPPTPNPSNSIPTPTPIPTMIQTPEPTIFHPVSHTSEFPQIISPELWQEQKSKILLFCRQFRYPEAKKLLSQTQGKLPPLVQHDWTTMNHLVQTESQPFYMLIEKIKKFPTTIKIRLLPIDNTNQLSPQEVTILNAEVTEENIPVLLPNGKRHVVLWNHLSGISFCQLLEQTKFAEESPIAAAQWAYRLGQEQTMELYLANAWIATPKAEVRIQCIECFAQLSKRDIPDHGWIVYQGHFVTQEEFNRLQAEEQQKVLEKRQQLDRDYLNNQRKQTQPNNSENSQREEEEFPLHWAVVDDLARTYGYQKAITKIVAYQEQLQSQELKNKLQLRLERIQPQAELFDKLIANISNGKLRDDQIVFDNDCIGQIIFADAEQFQVKLPNGEITFKWYSLPPKKMAEFFKRLSLSSKDFYCLGIFSFENGLVEEGNRAFVQALSQDPQLKTQTDTYLANWLEIPMPDGGFVPFQGLLITRDEREQRQKGLVRYGKEWVTPEVKEKLSSGLILYQGKWITPLEKDRIKKGYIKYQDRWYTSDELNQLRQNWEHAWALSTTHYDIKTNISEPFIQELGNFLEAAFIEYGKLFGCTTDKQMTVYAFRTYEDYRNFCIKNNTTGQLRAGGFAHSQLNTGVAWMRVDTKQIMEVLIHEGAHLFQFNACPKLRAPSWYAEAIATQFEGFTWDGKNLVVTNLAKSRLAWVQNKIKNKQYIPLADLWGKNGLELLERDPDQSMNFYAQSWSVYYYLSHTTDKKAKETFQSWTKQMNNGEFNGRESKAVSDLFDSMQNLEEDWKSYMLTVK